MGIIIKQSFKGSLFSYLGIVVGYINVGIIMPQFFMVEQIGLVQLFAAISMIFTNFSMLGFGSVINRIFPEFRDKSRNHNGFPFLILFTGLLGFVLSVLAFFILKPHIIESNIQKSPLLVEYIYLLIPLFFFRIIFKLFNQYNRVLYDAVSGPFWADFIHKTVNLLLIILFALGWFSFRQFIFGYICSLSMPAIPIAIILIKRGELNIKPDFHFLKRPLVKEILIVAAYGLINGLSGSLTSNIDKLFVNQYLSLEQVGIFSICALFATVIMVPSRATVKISTGIIAQSWKKNNLKHIQEIYSKASLNQTIIGSLILIGILVNLDSIFTILPEIYSQGKWVLIIYSIGILIRVSGTTNGAIIQTSKHYKALSVIIVFQIIATIFFHTTFIPIWGITGAALSVCLTYMVRTVSAVTFIKMKFKMFCYSYKHLLIIFIAAVSFGLGNIIPNTGMLIPNILLKSLSIFIIFSSLILIFRVSLDINRLFFKILGKFINLIKK